jgi:hypothetical protein
MPHGNTLSRLLIASLAAATIAAPAAVAQPTEPVTTTQSAVAADQELRTEAAKDQSRAPAPKQLPGPPTWPMHPRALTPPQQAPVADDGDGGGVEAPVVALIIAGTLALGGGLTAAAARHRTRTNVAH